MNQKAQRLQTIKAAADSCRRRQLALLIEKIDQIERTPARDPDQAALKEQAIRELIERVG